MTDEEIFQQALSLSESERDVLINEVCREDALQQRRVEKLLSAYSKSDGLLATEANESESHAEAGVPREIGDFEIGRLLGRGGMGVVYEAKQKSLKRTVALKMLSSGLGLSSRAILRFRREAEAAGKLHHTNIVPIYTTGEENGVHFYAMEMINGPSLDRVIAKLRNGDRNVFAARDENIVSKSGSRGSAQHFDAIAAKFAEVADALEHAHEHGVIHRDIKPSNILLGPDGSLSINDFGLARMLEQPGMTMTGEFVGSPLYMSPEQIAAGRTPIDHRTDIYSLGATLYEILTQQPPFPGDSRDQVLTGILHKEPASPRKRDPQIPLDLDTIVMKAIEKDPDKRYQTAGKLAEDLRAFVNRHAISARRLGPIGRVVKVARRNPLATSFAVFVLIAAMAIVGIIRSADITRKQEQRENERSRLVESLMRGVRNETDVHIEKLASLDAGESELEFARGIQRLFLEDFERAKEHLEPLVDHSEFGLSARSLLALAELWSGFEDSYFLILDDLHSREPVTFEESLFLGYANIWNDPRKTMEYLEKAEKERPNFPVVRFLRGMATRYHAMLNVSDPQERLKLLEEASKDVFAGGDEYRTPMALMERLSVRLMQSQVLKRLAVATDEAEQEVSRSRDSEQRADEARQILAELIEFETDHVAQTAIAFAHVMLGDDLEFLQLADRWFDSDMEIIVYAIQPILCRLLSLHEYERANRWLSLYRGRPAENAAFFRLYVRLMSPDRTTSFDQLRLELLDIVAKKRRGSAVYIELDAALLHLLGDEQAWKVYASSKQPLGTRQHVYPTMNRYFGMPETNRITAEQLISECETSDHPPDALSHAYFGLGLEAIAADDPKRAADYFNRCLDQGVHQFFVYWLSQAMLDNEYQWKRWHDEREASLERGATP